MSYLPLFILSKVIPFVGLGLIAGEANFRRSFLSIDIIFILTLFLGFLLAFATSELSIFLFINNFLILVLGSMMLSIERLNGWLKMTILILAGFSLGYEYALDIFKFDEFRWMFSALLGTGLISYLILTRMRIFSNSSWKALRFILGVFFVGMGIIVVLLT